MMPWPLKQLGNHARLSILLRSLTTGARSPLRGRSLRKGQASIRLTGNSRYSIVRER